jgi:hypothetical protein
MLKALGRTYCYIQKQKDKIKSLGKFAGCPVPKKEIDS